MSIYFGGVDIGSTTGKAVILGEQGIVASAIFPSRPDPRETAEAVFLQALNGTPRESVKCIIGTGYGRNEVPFAEENLSEISCHAAGVFYLDPVIRTIVDIGGQDLKAISLHDDGSVREFAMNDKCAAGTGRFLENMARVLHVSLDELSTLSLDAKRAVPITSQCSVFAETEVISLLAQRTPREEVAAGLNTSICRRIAGLVRRAGLVEGVTVTGGAAKNQGLWQALGKILRVELRPLPADPQLMGALGAAVLARKRSCGSMAP